MHGYKACLRTWTCTPLHIMLQQSAGWCTGCWLAIGAGTCAASNGQAGPSPQCQSPWLQVVANEFFSPAGDFDQAMWANQLLTTLKASTVLCQLFLGRHVPQLVQLECCAEEWEICWRSKGAASVSLTAHLQACNHFGHARIAEAPATAGTA